MRRLLLAPLTLLLVGCGEDFAPAHELQSLRVLAVQKSEPYTRPGSTVELRMLWHDARDGGPSFDPQTQIHWFSGCVNPLGDSYAACFADVAIAYLMRALPPQQLAGSPYGYGQGETFSVRVPEQGAVQPPRDPSQPPYGSAFVFFAACAGELVLDPELEGPLSELWTRVAVECFDPALAPDEQMACASEIAMGDPTLTGLLDYRGFPLLCRDPSGDVYLGADDYVAGYSQLFVYEEQSGITNTNPTIDGVRFDGETLVDCTCIDAACLGAPECPDDAVLPSVPTCSDDGGMDCPEYVFEPVLSRERVVEQDAALPSGLEEQIWINYYVDAGGVSSPLRLLNEAERGWNPEYRTLFRAPRQPGRVNLWAVVHDNRGGTAWVKQTIQVGD